MKISHYIKTLRIERVLPVGGNQYVVYIRDYDFNYFYVTYFCQNKLMPYKHPNYLDTSRYSHLYKSFPIREVL